MINSFQFQFQSRNVAYRNYYITKLSVRLWFAVQLKGIVALINGNLFLFFHSPFIKFLKLPLKQHSKIL